VQQLPEGPIAGRTVTLRLPVPSDANGIAEACNDPVTRRFLPMLPDPYTAADALEWITVSGPAARVTGGAQFAIVLSDSDRIAGAIGLHVPPGDGRRSSIGYWVAPWARGRGVATDAVRTLAACAFDHGIGRAELLTEPNNAASQRVAVAAGFAHEVVRRAASAHPDGRRDMVVWSRLPTDPASPGPRALPDLPNGLLTDGVVTLTPIVESDADDMYRLASLPEVVATTVARHAPTRASVEERCATGAYKWLIGERAGCAIRDAASGEFAGNIGVFLEPATGQALVGYGLTRVWRGRGFASRAVRLVADWAFDVAAVARLSAGTAPDNIASQRTLERAGFRREGYERARLPSLDGGRVDNVAWALLPGDREPIGTPGQ
jgi:RimJ/RimL family protein N-acetyltransferase